MPKDVDDDELNLPGVDQLEPDAEDVLDPVDDEEPEGDEPDESEEPQEGEPEELAAGDRRQEPERPPSRAQRRIASLHDKSTRAEKALQDANRRIDELLSLQRQQQQPLTTQVESAAQRETRRASLTPEERIQEDLRDTERRVTQQFQTLQGATWDQNDRTFYETKASIDPLFKKWQPRVEQELQTLRKNGQGAPREAILYYLLGKAMAEGRSSKGNRQRKTDAERRVKSNTTRPGASPRGDVQPAPRRGGRSLEDRLSDVPL